MSEINPKLSELVNALPVLYQPVYGHHEWDNKAQRSCEDRLPDIKKIYDSLSEKLHRPLRVLDLGCNMAYLSLTICSWGGGVLTAVDSSKKFLEFGEFLSGEHPDFKIKFVNEKIEKFIPTIKDDEYDLVLGLSLFHWVTKQIGFKATQELMNILAEKIPVGLFELAPASEFPEIKLPKNYREYLKGYFFIRVLNRTTWSDKRKCARPLCFASNNYVHFDDLGVLKIDEVPRKDRKHCICGDKFIKVLTSPNQEIPEMAQNEIKFLQELGGSNGLPKLHTTLQETDETGTRIFMIRDNIKGRTLLSKGTENIDSWNAIEQILRWIISLEKRGYYQKDLLCSNFICNEDGKIIPIDYGLMIHDPISHRWPFNLHLTFFGFMNVILAKKARREIRLNIEGNTRYYCQTTLLTEFSQYVSDDKYHRILALNDDEKFFENLYEILFSTPNSATKVHPFHTIAEVETLEKEQYLHDLCITAMQHEKLIHSLTQTVSQQKKEIEKLKSVIRKKLSELSAEI